MARALHFLGAICALAWLFSSPVAHAQATAVVLPTCASASYPTTSSSGVRQYPTMDPTGAGCTNASVTAITGGATTDKSGTITLGGTAQTAIALNAARKGWCIQNPPTATEVLSVRVNGTASATTGTTLSPGQQACNQAALIDTAAVSVFAATTAHAFTGFELQ